jgi:hypothetical protein
VESLRSAPALKNAVWLSRVWRAESVDVRDPVLRGSFTYEPNFVPLVQGRLSRWPNIVGTMQIRRVMLAPDNPRLAAHYARLMYRWAGDVRAPVAAPARLVTLNYDQLLLDFRFLDAVHRMRDHHQERDERLAAMAAPLRLREPEVWPTERAQVDAFETLVPPTVEPQAMPRETRAGPQGDADPDSPGPKLECR